MVNNGVIHIDHKDRNRANNLLTCRTGFELVRVLVAAPGSTIETEGHSSPPLGQKNISDSKTTTMLKPDERDELVKKPQNYGTKNTSVNERDSDNNAILNSDKNDQDESNGNESNSTQSDESNNISNEANISNANAPVPGSSATLPINIVEKFCVDHEETLIIMRDDIESEINRINSAKPQGSEGELDTSEVCKRLTEGLEVIKTLLERHQQVSYKDKLQKAHTVLNEFIANVRKSDKTDSDAAADNDNSLVVETQRNIDMKAYINAIRTVIKDGTDFEKCLKSVYGIEREITHTKDLAKLSEDELDSIISLLNAGLTKDRRNQLRQIINPTLTDDQMVRVRRTENAAISEEGEEQIQKLKKIARGNLTRQQKELIRLIYKPKLSPEAKQEISKLKKDLLYLHTKFYEEEKRYIILRHLCEKDRLEIWRIEEEPLTDKQRTQINRILEAALQPETHQETWNIRKENLTKEDFKKIYEILRQSKLNDDQAKNAYKILVTERIRKLMEPLTKYRHYTRPLLESLVPHGFVSNEQIAEWLPLEHGAQTDESPNTPSPPKTRSWLSRPFRSLSKCVAGSNQ